MKEDTRIIHSLVADRLPYFYHFMDSVGFVRDDERHWIVQ